MRQVKIGDLYDGSSCCWCGDLLFLGDDGVICEACGSPSHVRCWTKGNGCNGCSRRVPYTYQPQPQPRTRVLETRPTRTLERGETYCPTCGDVVAGYCFQCRSAQLAYTGPKKTLPEANHAFIYAVVGLVCFGFVLGPIAIVKANSAKRQIAADPRYDGAGLATAAQIIGWIEVGLSVLWILGLVLQVLNASL